MQQRTVKQRKKETGAWPRQHGFYFNRERKKEQKTKFNSTITLTYKTNRKVAENKTIQWFFAMLMWVSVCK